MSQIDPRNKVKVKKRYLEWYSRSGQLYSGIDSSQIFLKAFFFNFLVPVFNLKTNRTKRIGRVKKAGVFGNLYNLKH
jgi:hypothetical protein